MTMIKISKTKAFKVEKIQMNDRKGPVLLSIRQMYSTQKDPEFKHGRQGITLAVEEDENGKSEARRVIKALIKALKDEDKPKLIKKDD